MLAQSFFSPSPSPSLYIPQYFHGIARRILINKNSVAIINPIFSTVSFFFFHPPPPRLQFISLYLPGHRVLETFSNIFQNVSPDVSSSFTITKYLPPFLFFPFIQACCIEAIHLLRNGKKSCKRVARLCLFYYTKMEKSWEVMHRTRSFWI